MRILEFHLEVADPERSANLYRALLPHHRVVSWSNGDMRALVLHDGTAFGLWKVGARGLNGGMPGTHVHFAFQIAPDEYDDYKQRLLDHGLEIQEHTWPNGGRSIYFFDYDGHQGEFMTISWLDLTAAQTS